LKEAHSRKVAGLATVPEDSKVTRIQLINAAGMAAFNFSIDGHALWVLALDGQPVAPQKVSNLLVNAAQRVDLAVCRVKKT
jgi:FtsP/CotA-like multicopper oxidase with cupredoxin domain